MATAKQIRELSAKTARELAKKSISTNADKLILDLSSKIIKTASLGMFQTDMDIPMPIIGKKKEIMEFFKKLGFKVHLKGSNELHVSWKN